LSETIALPVKPDTMVHDAIYAYFSSRIAAQNMTQDELHAQCWQALMAYCWIVEAAQKADCSTAAEEQG
jgi:hypothetical protein